MKPYVAVSVGYLAVWVLAVNERERRFYEAMGGVSREAADNLAGRSDEVGWMDDIHSLLDRSSRWRPASGDGWSAPVNQPITRTRAGTLR